MRKNIFFKYMVILCATFLYLNGKNFKVVAPWEISGLEPPQSGYIFTRLQVGETLVTTNQKGELIPSLAKDWKVSKDGLTWTFSIRKNIKFHDDTILDSNIVAYNLNREETLKKSVLRYIPLKSIKAKGNNLIVSLKSKFSPLPAYFAHFSTIILSKNSFSENGKVHKIIGTGAYKIKKILAPLKVDLIRNDNWWNGKANIKNIEYLAVSKGETRTLMIKSKEANIAYNILPISLKSLKKKKFLNTKIVPIPRVTLLKVNSGSKFFNTPRLRKAISLAINREAIAIAILKDKKLAATQLFPSFMKSWHNSKLEALTMDIKKSRKLLDSEGWRLSKDGFRYKDGKKFQITLDTYPSTPVLPIIATAIQAQLKKVGIEVKILIGNYTEIIRKHKDNSLNLGLISRNFALVPSPFGTLIQDYGKGGANWGAMNWKNNEMFSSLEKLKNKEDKNLHFKITEILQEELPSIPVTWASYIVVSNKKVENLKIDPFEINYNLSDAIWHK